MGTLFPIQAPWTRFQMLHDLIYEYNNSLIRTCKLSGGTNYAHYEFYKIIQNHASLMQSKSKEKKKQKLHGQFQRMRL